LLDVEVRHALLLYDGLHQLVVLLEQAADEPLSAVEWHIAAIVAADKDLALLIEDVQG
jgi:hypothetical protein